MMMHRFVVGLLAGLLWLSPVHGAVLKPGELVPNFTLTDRSGKPVKLSDFEGKIIFLEWFAHWCTFCRAAAQQIEPGIVQYYAGRGGNPDGIEVVHIILNLQFNAEAATTGFINQFKLQNSVALNDFYYGVSSAIRSQAVVNQIGSPQPTFAIINGVAGSPSHQQWELLFSHNGYGNLTSPIETFRAKIDSVKRGLVVEPPSVVTLGNPERRPDGAVHFLVEGNRRETIEIQGSSDLKTFVPLGNAPMDPMQRFRVDAAPGGFLFFRAQRKAP